MGWFKQDKELFAKKPKKHWRQQKEDSYCQGLVFSIILISIESKNLNIIYQTIKNNETNNKF